jgi:Fanconi anemia group M protein
MPFHNIFSLGKGKNKPASKQTSKILVDIHEKNSLVPSFLSKNNITYEFQPLKIGDYIISNIVIERKTLSDLKSSIITKRIFDQLKNLKQYPKCFLLIETNEQEIDNVSKGFILSSALNYKIPIIFSKNEQDTAGYLSLLAKKKEKESISLRAKIPMNENEQKQFILEGFPGIGPATAKNLLKEFKTIRAIINATKERLEKILGKKTDLFMKLME